VIQIQNQPIERVVCSFSCGAASFVATKLALDQYQDADVEFHIVYADTGSEHPDNWRFLRDAERFLDYPVTILRSKVYRNIWETFESEGFIKQQRYGAICTTELKRKPIMEFSKPGDAWVIGFSLEEQHRLTRMTKDSYGKGDTVFLAPLIDRGLSHSDVKAVVLGWGIELPELYKLGYRTNNCIGCVKGGIGYWNKIRDDFPEIFERMAKIERRINFTILKDRRNQKSVPLFLDELEQGHGRMSVEEISCSEICHEMLNFSDEEDTDPNSR
jgi:3'-phosphoadenosine 5'-phosphosulfate sulfotransferase (PAPS reductase)/FAD synthetase